MDNREGLTFTGLTVFIGKTGTSNIRKLSRRTVSLLISSLLRLLSVPTDPSGDAGEVGRELGWEEGADVGGVADKSAIELFLRGKGPV